MSEWTVYWVMQMDHIRDILGGAMVIFLIFFVLSVLFKIIISVVLSSMGKNNGHDPEWRDPDYEQAVRLNKVSKKLMWYSVPLFVIFGIINILLPTTKTLASVYILPKIFNSPIVRQEAKEMYNLAKQALAKAADIESKPDKIEPEEDETK